MNNINNESEKSGEISQKVEDKNESEPQDNQLLSDFLNRIKNTPAIINRLDYYPNSIPLGSFCFAVSFILYGFHEAKVHKAEDNFLYLIIFLFGGIGQLTAGIFEFIKSRTYVATLYITYSLYFLSFYFAKKNDIFILLTKILYVMVLVNLILMEMHIIVSSRMKTESWYMKITPLGIFTIILK